MRAIPWTRDNDHYFGPFTYARDRRYKQLAVMLGSGDGDEHPGCRLRLAVSSHTLIIALPPIIRPWRKKVFPRWDAETVKRLGRDWYWDTHQREFGFSISGTGMIGDVQALHVHFGAQTHDSSSTKSKCYFLPWTDWRHVRHSLYRQDGTHFADVPQGARFGSPEYEAAWALQEACPTVEFSFQDFDGEQLTVTTKIEEREWHRGTGWFKWLAYVSRPIIRRSLDLRFSGETGRRKGTWKGGTLGHAIEMLPGELHEAAFRRYCAEHSMNFVGLIAEQPG